MSDDRVTVWVRDDLTGEVRSSADWHGGFRFSAQWWADGDGSCDCNRHKVMSPPDGEYDEYVDGFTAGLYPGDSYCLGHNRYRIVRVEPMPEGMTLAEFNRGYVREEG